MTDSAGGTAYKMDTTLVHHRVCHHRRWTRARCSHIGLSRRTIKGSMFVCFVFSWFLIIWLFWVFVSPPNIARSFCQLTARGGSHSRRIIITCERRRSCLLAWSVVSCIRK